MTVIDYNGEGQWTCEAILARYAKYATQAGIPLRDLSPRESTERERHWVYPVMHKVIEGIEAGDPACIRLGIEFIEEDARFRFGKILKSNAARALRRATLTEDQGHRILKRVFRMLEAGVIPHEFKEYAKLAKSIGFTKQQLPDVDEANVYGVRYRNYFVEAVAAGS
jgi:hypothetical protein